MKRKISLISLLSCAAFAQAPSIVSVTPNNGTGAQQTFSVTVQDANGSGMNITQLHLLVNKENGTHGCHVLANPQANQITLYNDDDTAISAWMTLGTSGAETNSRCTLYANGSYRNVNGAQVTIAILLGFNQTNFPGAEFLDVEAGTCCAVSNGGGYITKGTWAVPPAAESYSVWSFNTYMNGVYGSPTGTGASVVYQHQGYDSLGPAAIGSQGIYLSGSTGACLLTFTRATHLVTLYADNWTMLTAVAGTPGVTLQNSQCTVDVGNTTYGDYTPWSLSIFTVPITFKPSFAGSAYLYASTNALSGGSTGWVSVGNWTIPTMTTTGSVSTTWQDMGSAEMGNDNFTGASVLLPSITNPAPYLALSTPSDNPIIKVGDPFTITISNAKPNSQVWVTLTTEPDPNVQQTATVGNLAGMTDSQGHFVWANNIASPALGARFYTFWVGYWGPTGTGTRPDTDIVGITRLFAQGPNGLPVAPAGLVILNNQ